jgi:hypothetical protein
LDSGPTNGVLTLNADGSFTYNPDTNFNGTDNFTYKANDGLADSSIATVTITITARVASNLVALYTFNDGSGTTINDVSGVNPLLPLTLNPAATSWISGGLSVDSSTIISTPVDTKIITACQGTNEITIEAWVKPANDTQGGPARIVTYSQDPNFRNFTLAQNNTTYIGRLRTADTGLNGVSPELVTSPGAVITTTLSHVVYTRDVTGTATIYVDGVVKGTRNDITGTFSDPGFEWDNSYGFALANEFTMNRTWLGEIYLVAIYDRALTSAEVSQNAGP